jgi:DHA2 family multidrug resistance protein-like MFS transporter
LKGSAGRPGAWSDDMPAPRLATRREWTGLVVLTLPALLISMDLSVLYLAVPKISAALQPSPAQLLWITDIYGFLLAGFLVTMGTLGDRFGRRRLLLIGGAAFGLASLAAAYAPSAGFLIAARAVLGIAGATLGPSTLSLIGAMFPDTRQRSAAIAVWSMSLSAGGALGPVVGGLMLERYWWGSVFLLAVPVMAVLVVAGPLLLAEQRDPKPGRLDLTSVGLGLTAVLGVIYGLKQLGQGGPAWPAAAAIAAGLGSGYLFVRRQARVPDPVVDLQLLRRPMLATALAANTLGFFIVLGITLLVDQQLQLVVGLGPLKTGLATVPMFIVFIGGALASPAVVAHVQPPAAITAGFLVAAAGLAILMAAPPGPAGFWPLVAGLVVLAAGLAPIFPMVTNLVLAAAPPQRAGAATGLAGTSTEFGGALGIAVLGITGSITYRAALAGSLPDQTPGQVVQAARGSLGAAMAAARALPEPLSSAVTAASQAGFTSGVHAASALGTLVAVSVAALVWLVRRRLPVHRRRAVTG